MFPIIIAINIYFTLASNYVENSQRPKQTPKVILLLVTRQKLLDLNAIRVSQFTMLGDVIIIDLVVTTWYGGWEEKVLVKVLLCTFKVYVRVMKKYIPKEHNLSRKITERRKNVFYRKYKKGWRTSVLNIMQNYRI